MAKLKRESKNLMDIVTFLSTKGYSEIGKENNTNQYIYVDQKITIVPVGYSRWHITKNDTRYFTVKELNKRDVELSYSKLILKIKQLTKEYNKEAKKNNKILNELKDRISFYLEFPNSQLRYEFKSNTVIVFSSIKNKSYVISIPLRLSKVRISSYVGDTITTLDTDLTPLRALTVLKNYLINDLKVSKKEAKKESLLMKNVKLIKELLDKKGFLSGEDVIPDKYLDDEYSKPFYSYYYDVTLNYKIFIQSNKFEDFSITITDTFEYNNEHYNFSGIKSTLSGIIKKTEKAYMEYLKNDKNIAKSNDKIIKVTNEVIEELIGYGINSRDIKYKENSKGKFNQEFFIDDYDNELHLKVVAFYDNSKVKFLLLDKYGDYSGLKGDWSDAKNAKSYLDVSREYSKLTLLSKIRYLRDLGRNDIMDYYRD